MITMTDKGLTDEEIIKTLECCAYSNGCGNCPYLEQCDTSEHLMNALDLINHYKTEIERQRQFIDSQNKFINKLATEFRTKVTEKMKQLKNLQK